jgi:hypothetical protein
MLDEELAEEQSIKSFVAEVNAASEARKKNEAAVASQVSQDAGEQEADNSADAVEDRPEIKPQQTAEAHEWRINWERMPLDVDELNNRLRDFGIRGKYGKDPLDLAAVQEFGNWLEAQGETTWARHLRARCVLDSQIPGDDYPTAMELYLETVNRLQVFPRLPVFSFSTSGVSSEQWWWSWVGRFAFGLPRCVKAMGYRGQQLPATEFVEHLASLIERTPVRGVDFAEHYAGELPEILASAPAAHLRSLGFSTEKVRDGHNPALTAIVKSPVVRKLERFSIEGNLRTDEEIAQLADAPCERLRFFEVFGRDGIDGSAAAATRLMNAPWFRRLEQIFIALGDNCCETGLLHLAEMPKLHSLALWNAQDRLIKAIPRAGEFPALRRLAIQNSNFEGPLGEAFCTLKAPQLIELWLDDSKGEPGDVRVLAESPLFAKLRILSLTHPRADLISLEAIAKSPCAAQLRILRLNCGDDKGHGTFSSLGSTPFNRPDAFPELTTLELNHPFAKKKSPRQTAKFLAGFASGKIQNLSLEDCEFDDDCAAALAANPAFAKLRRLSLGQLHTPQTKLTAKGAEILFRSQNLNNLVQLRLDRLEVGAAGEILADPAILPNLQWWSSYQAGVPKEIAEKVREKRPFIRLE